MRTYANLRWQRRRIEKILALVPTGRTDHLPRPTRHHQHRLKPDEIFDLVADYNDGARINDLAAKYGISRVTVMSHLKRQGAESRRGVVERRLEEAISLYEQKWSLAKIGELMGVSASTVLNALKKAGVDIRSTHG